MSSANPVELLRFGSAQELAEAVARQWVDRAPSTRFIALSGGRIARLLFESASRFASASLQSFSHSHFFWADERCVPPSDSESNFAVANDLLLKPLNVNPARVHRILGELDPNEAATRAEAEIRLVTGADARTQPILDLVFLGMGEDGHIASIFRSESDRALADLRVYREVTGPKPPFRRVTIGLPTLAAARNVWVLVSGSGKEDALRVSLKMGNTPLGRLLRCRSSTRVFTDSPL